MSGQENIVKSLAAALGKDGTPVRLFETHISWVLVAGRYAYKLKKPVRFDFVDFSSLEARRFFCMEEVRLNRRLAPDLYLDVVAVTGSVDDAAIGSAGEAIEYAVRMRAFDQQSLWSWRISQRLLSIREIDELATKIACFHRAAAIAPDNSPWGLPAVLQAVADDNLERIRELATEGEGPRWALRLRQWDDAQRRDLGDAFDRRKALGSIRECHGDLHSGNIVTTDGRVEAFDCIEFNESLRWIDAMNDITFTCMDLRFRRRADMAARLLNQYLEQTGDYDGLRVLRYYEVHRALVRAKVALLRIVQLADAAEAARWRRQGHDYLKFSISRIRPRTPAVMITHGYSGCGKTTFAKRIVELFGAVQLRSDVERKRMRGLAATDRSGAALGSTLYGRDATRLTYGRLLDLARQIAMAGWPVIVDAAFSKAEQRAPFAALAAELGLPFFIFDIRASFPTMLARLEARQKRGSDASDAGPAILERQRADLEPLSDKESGDAIVIDMESSLDEEGLRRRMRRRWGEETSDWDDVDVSHADVDIGQYAEFSKKTPKGD